MADQLRVGVVGTGGMGARHARNVDHQVGSARLTAVMDIDADRAAAVAEPAGAQVFTDGFELISSDTVDAVILASPDPTHAALASACLEHDKHALVEKPLATDLAGAAAVVDAEASLGRRLLQVGLMRHYDPQHVAVRDALHRGDVGRPLMFRGWHRNPPEARPPTSEEVLVNSAVHDIYSARWLLNDEISEVFVRGTTIHPDRTDQLDLQRLTMVTAGGAIASVEVNKDSGFGYEVGVEISGSHGMVTTAPHHTPVIRQDGAMSQSVEPDWLARFAEAYIIEVRAWVSSVINNRPEGPTAWDGYLTLGAALAGAKSVTTGAPVTVDTPERPALYSYRDM
ncbi:MAG: Gfo/Idh/MocA family oxidoreductase [Acidimicrobiia bacterium]|nr:Gfo/Idh/MocA family oxidoreductase [Acidimicrobiia bacterium]MDX2467186.1 Gfo/Idh/MocA family oxidoreductase [Acidimicrobiia bacterium]